MFEKDGIVYESEEEYLFAEKEEVKKSRGCVWYLIFILIILALCFFAFWKFMCPVDYRIFTEKRTEFVEEKYKMDFSDVNLQRYWEPLLARDVHGMLKFNEIDDYKAFMENNFEGEIIKCDYDGQILEDGTVIDYGDNDGNKAAFYSCVADDIEFNITFYIEGNKYSAKIVDF